MMASRDDHFVSDGSGIAVTNENLCQHCRWYDHAHPGLGRCKAFPNHIPVAILTNEFDHTEPFPGDHGIRFEPIDEKAATIGS